MPLCYSDKHDQFLHNYIQNPTLQNTTNMIERLIVALTKDGYIKPINIFVKVLPDLD